MNLLTEIFQTALGIIALIFSTLKAMGRLAWRKTRNWWKNRSKWLRRSVATIFVVIPVGFLLLWGYVMYLDNFGRDYWDRRLSENIELHSFSDNTWRVYDCTAEEYTTDKINWISDVPENDSLAVYAIPNKRGYIDVITGRIIIDAEANDYRKAWVFSEGVAAVMKEGKIGFINTDNEVVIPFQFDFSEECRMWNFAYLFHGGYCIMTNEDGNLGLIDKSGNWVVEPAYDQIWAPHESGYRVVVNDGKYGVLDSKCDMVYPVDYAFINIVSDGFVFIKGGKMWQTDFEGNITHPFLYNYSCYMSYSESYDECGNLQETLADYMKYEVMNNYGIMNRLTGEPITPAIYSEINMLSKELFEVQESDSYDWYLLDTKGNMVVYE